VYSGGTTPSLSHVVFRLRWTGGTNFATSDGNSTGDTYSFAALANATVASKPTLNLTTAAIPEPATVGLFVISGSAIILARRVVYRKR
jgi:hypothetical protein